MGHRRFWIFEVGRDAFGDRFQAQIVEFSMRLKYKTTEYTVYDDIF